MRVGFVGLGKMGRQVAFRLQAAGHNLVVNDLSAEAAAEHLAAGATWASSPAELMAGCEVTFASLPRPEDVEAVALGRGGLIEGVEAGKVFFDLSTNSLDTIRAIDQAFRARGAVVCDAPVSGGPAGAAVGKLAVYIGGDLGAVSFYRPVIETFSDQIIHVGELGAGTVAKLMHNCAAFAINAALAEVFTVGVRAGAEPMALWRVLRSGAIGRRRTFDTMAAQFLPNEYDKPGFTLALAHKDMRLATTLAQDIDVPMRVANLALADMTEALERGWGDRGSAAAMLLQSERAHVDIRIPREDLDLELRGKEQQT